TQRVIPAFPGATVAVGADGTIQDAWLGPASPIESASGDFLAALDVDDVSSDAARVQLLLASACGAIASAWPLLASDAPTVLLRRDGRPLAMLWQPIIVAGRIDGIAAFAVAAEPLLLEPDGPTQPHRLSVAALP